MDTAIKTFLAISILMSPTSYGAEREFAIPDLNRIDPSQFQEVNTQMTPQEYRDAFHYNQRITLKAMETSLKGAAVSLGVSEDHAELVGAAIGLAVSGAEFNLNKRKGLSLELDDPAETDRSLMLKWKLHWD